MRLALRISGCLLAGLLTAIVAAEVLTNVPMSSPQAGVSRMLAWHTGGDLWMLLSPEVQFGRTHFFVVALDSNPRRSPVHAESSPPPVGWRFALPTEYGTQREVFMAGWPCRCAWWGNESRIDKARTPIGFVRRSEFGRFGVATGILWPGLLANTAFYAAIWFGLLLTPGLIRRARRRRRGQCVACGYDLTATPAQAPCPECGHAVSRPNLPTQAID